MTTITQREEGDEGKRQKYSVVRFLTLNVEVV